jgi:hypothetical protein
MKKAIPYLDMAFELWLPWGTLSKTFHIPFWVSDESD